MIANMTVLPLLALIIGKLNLELWFASELSVMPLLLLGGLFIPMYIVGKKYE